VRRAGTAEAVAEIPQEDTEPFDLVSGRQGERRTGGDMFANLIQRGVEVLGGRSAEPQRDVIRHATKLLAGRDVPLQA
jgi:hypothetical protein